MADGAIAQSILTVAGGGTDDGRPATAAALSGIQSVAVDHEGNVFIAQLYMNRIRRVDARTGVISTVAGNGSTVFSGDGGPATQAGFKMLAGLAVDGGGNLFISDGQANRVRRIDARTGIITTIAGGGSIGYSGDGVPATAAALSPTLGDLGVDEAGNVYVPHRSFVSGRGVGWVSKVDARTGMMTTVAGNGSGVYSGDGGPATAAGLADPYSVAVDRQGNIFIAEAYPCRVRRVDAQTGIITTVAGNGSTVYSGDGGPATAAGIGEPYSFAVDGEGNIFVGGAGTGRVRRVDARTGIITTIAGSGSTAYSGDGGPATAAGIGGDPAVAVDGSGNLFLSSLNARGIRRVDALTGTIVTMAGNGDYRYTGDGGPATLAAFVDPVGVGVDSSQNMFVADRGSGLIRRVDGRTGAITTVAGGGVRDDGPPTEVYLFPSDVTEDGHGNLFIADNLNCVRRFSKQLNHLSPVAGECSDVSAPRFSGDGGPATQAKFGRIESVAVDKDGNYFIADHQNNRIRRVDGQTGIVDTIAGNGQAAFSGDGGLATAASLRSPRGVAVDAMDGLLIADGGNHRIRRVDGRTGVITSVAGTGTAGSSGDGGLATAAKLDSPSRVSVDGHGDIYVVESRRVRRIEARTGLISTLTGTGSSAFSGDGRPATAAGLGVVDDVVADAAGNVFLASSNTRRVRAVYACVPVGPPSLTDPQGGAVSSATLAWTPVAGAFRYDVYLDTASPPTRVLAADVAYITPNPFTIPQGTGYSYVAANLLPATTYYWRVVAKGDPYCPTVSTAPSEVRSFTTPAVCEAPGAFGLLSPGGGATEVPAVTQLTWQPSSGASTYDVYLGTTSPPPLVASGLNSPSYAASGLSPGATYYWNVVAHAACDPSRTTLTTTQSFTVAGTCAAAGAFSQTSPSSGASSIPTSPTLTWTASANASAYDVYLGSTTPPALYAPGVSGTSLAVSGLTPGGTYYWKVVARVTCGQGLDRETPVQTFTVAGTCISPQATTFTFVPPGGVSVGQTYAIAWKDSPGVDAGGGYLVERSTDISFPASRDTQRTTGTSATFVANAPGTYYHRIRPVASCGAEGNNTFPAPVQAVPGAPNIVFTVQPSAVVTALGDRLEDQKTTFTLENISKSPVTAIIGTGTLSGIPFFTVYDPLGQSTALQILEPRKPKTFEIRFSGPPADKATSYEGIVSVAAAGLPVVPYAFVNLKVGGSSTSAPVFKLAGAAAEYASFSGYATKGDETLRPPLSVEIQNPGNTPMELGAEIGPELWLVPEPGWNATAIQPNSSRTIRFTTRRTWAPNGSALPRYTYFTLRTKSGQTARLLVQDNDASALSQARSSQLDRSVRAYLIPSVAHVGAQGGGSFISRVRLSNTGTEEVQADLLFTPSGSDGFDPVTVKKATVIVPKNDLVNLTDPLVQLFGLTPPAYGTLEVRAAAEKIGFLTVTSGVDAPAPAGGSYGFQMPVAIRGEGARLGVPHLIPGITATASYRTNLILAETTGIDGASVRVTLYDNKGTKIGDRLTSVPRYGQEQISNVVPALGGVSLEAARLELTVESGGGSVVGVVTVIDSATLDAASYASQPGTTPATGSFLARAMKKPLWSQGAAQKSTLLVPSIVNGFASFKGRDDLPYTFKSLMGFTSGTLSPATFTLTYKDQQNAKTTVKTVTVNPRQTVEYKNVVEELFGLPPGAKSQGPVFVEADLNGIVYSKVYSNLDKGSLGDAFPIVKVGPSPGEELLGKVSGKPILIDGLEQSEDETRGTRSNLILTEVLGYPTTVTVSLYEAGNRTTPIAERDVTISGLDKVQLSTVFGGLELDTGKDYVTVPSPRRKDRTNVLCVVTPKSGEGMVSAVVTTIDNKTADLRNAVLTPTGGVPASGSGVGVGR